MTTTALDGVDTAMMIHKITNGPAADQVGFAVVLICTSREALTSENTLFDLPKTAIIYTLSILEQHGSTCSTP